MRKATILFVSLVILFGGLFLAANILVSGYQDDVTWQQEHIFGDPAAAEGLQVTAKNTLDNQLLWRSEGTPGQQPVTEFFYRIEVGEADEGIYDGIVLAVDEELYLMSPQSWTWWPDYYRQRYAGLVDWYQNIYSFMEEDSEIKMALDLPHYLEYYPLDGWFDLPGIETVSWRNYKQTSTKAEPDRRGEVFNEYFKIPIMGEYTLRLNIRKFYSSMEVYVAEIQADYLPAFFGITTEDTCYFTFDPIADDGRVADCSQIPGGYGIYSFRYTLDKRGKVQVDLNSLTTCVSLEPEGSYEDMWVSEDGKRIHLLTRREDGLYLTVADPASGTSLQELALPAPKELDVKVQPGKGFLAVFCYNYEAGADNSVTVFAEETDGLYAEVFTAPLNREIFSASTLLDLVGPDFAMAFDGTHLALAKNVMDHTSSGDPLGECCDYYTLVYDSTGMIYAEKTHVNLSFINATDKSLFCTPYGNTPLILEWNN